MRDTEFHFKCLVAKQICSKLIITEVNDISYVKDFYYNFHFGGPVGSFIYFFYFIFLEIKVIFSTYLVSW